MRRFPSVGSAPDSPKSTHSTPAVKKAADLTEPSAGCACRITRFATSPDIRLRFVVDGRQELLQSRLSLHQAPARRNNAAPAANGLNAPESAPDENP